MVELGSERRVDQATHNKIVSFVWGIADDVLRDLFKRDKYPDVILPMCVIRRMDAVLEPRKQKVLEIKKMLDEAQITEQRAALANRPLDVPEADFVTLLAQGIADGVLSGQFLPKLILATAGAKVSS